MAEYSNYLGPERNITSQTPVELMEAHSISPAASSPVTTIIEPRRGWRLINLAEIWRYRDLLFFLAWRDTKVRYKQTVLGVLWAVIQPLLIMVVLTIAFGKFGRMMEHSSVPYPLLTFCAAVPWTLFAASLMQAGNSLVGNQNLISKVYFPRVLIPLSSIASALLDFAVALGVLGIIMAIYGVAPQWPVLLLPLFVLLVVMTSLAVGLWLSALNVEYRDVRYVIPFLTQLWMLASPVGYSSSEVSGGWQTLYGLNPMAGVIEGFRWALLGTAPPAVGMMLVSTSIMVVLLVSGLLYFSRVQETFADVI